MSDELIKIFKDEAGKVFDHLHQELAGLRTGRANPALLHNVSVLSYGSKMPLSQLANIGTQDARTLVVTPWDKGQLPEIEKAIQTANLGLNPASDGQVIRVVLPALTEDRRKELVKLIGQTAEKARISLRTAREDVIKRAKKAEDSDALTKDELQHFQKKLQEVVDGYNDEVKQIATEKEKEVMTV